MSNIEEAQQIRRNIKEVIGYNVNVELTIEPHEFYVYTPLWQISMEKPERINQSDVKVLAVFIDGGKIALLVKDR